MNETVALTCTGCQAPLEPGDRFCEQCGARTVEEEPATGECLVCGAPESKIDEYGYCSVCGARERDRNDRLELDLTVAAAVSDRGRVHRRNEDAFRVEVAGPDAVAAVICDGISSASSGDVAARRAADAAVTVLVQALSDRDRDGDATTLDAFQAANDAVGQVEWTARANRGWPSCTMVSALTHRGEIVIGSVGDSRAYWLDLDGARQLTIDDSEDAHSHAITHWIGADAPPRPPRLSSWRPTGPGRLLLCTDGLWNYVPTEEELADHVSALPGGASPSAIASRLTDIAVARGGRDNITIAVIDLHPSGEADEL